VSHRRINPSKKSLRTLRDYGNKRSGQNFIIKTQDSNTRKCGEFRGIFGFSHCAIVAGGLIGADPLRGDASRINGWNRDSPDVPDRV
jgi:hypothetical protein